MFGVGNLDILTSTTDISSRQSSQHDLYEGAEENSTEQERRAQGQGSGEQDFLTAAGHVAPELPSTFVTCHYFWTHLWAFSAVFFISLYTPASISGAILFVFATVERPHAGPADNLIQRAISRR